MKTQKKTIALSLMALASANHNQKEQHSTAEDFKPDDWYHHLNRKNKRNIYKSK